MKRFIRTTVGVIDAKDARPCRIAKPKWIARLHLFSHRTFNLCFRDKWSVSEPLTGWWLATDCDTRQIAVRKAIARLKKRGREKTLSTIKAHLAECSQYL